MKPIQKIIDVLKTREFRAKAYTLVLLLALYLVSRGVITASDSDFVIGIAGVVLGTEGAAEAVKRARKQ